jgi:hypothetical protein
MRDYIFLLVVVFRAVEAAIMLNALYLSLWVINFITVANRDFSPERGPYMQILM